MKLVKLPYFKPLLAAIFLVTSIAWLAGFFNNKMEPLNRDITVDENTPTYLVKSEKTQRHEVVSATLSALQETDISSRILANVEQVNVRAGQQVQKDQLLISLAKSDLLAQVDQNQQQHIAVSARVIEADKLLKRAQELHNQQLLSSHELDKAQANFDALNAEKSAAQAGLNQAKTNLSFAKLTAPIDGVVIERLIEPGNVAQPGQLLLSIYNPNTLQVEVYVREQLAIHLNLQDTLTINIPSLHITTAAQITEIIPAANVGARSFLIKANLQTNHALKPGMYATVSLATHFEDVVLIPQNYVNSLGQLNIVWVKENNMISRRFVRLGLVDEHGNVEIIAGLTQGDQIVKPIKS